MGPFWKSRMNCVEIIPGCCMDFYLAQNDQLYRFEHFCAWMSCHFGPKIFFLGYSRFLPNLIFFRYFMILCYVTYGKFAWFCQSFSFWMYISWMKLFRNYRFLIHAKIISGISSRGGVRKKIAEQMSNFLQIPS